MTLPALSLIAVPGRRARTLEVAVEIERRGFAGIWCPSYGSAMALCQGIAAVTSSIPIGTSIQPIYGRHASDLAAHASFIQEISGGRFHLGLGVSHESMNARLGVETGKPLADTRSYVAELKANEKASGPLPPIVLATLRDKMLDLAVEIGDGAVWANASRSAIARSVSRVPTDRKQQGFFIGNMIPTVIDDDRAAAAAINRRTLTGYIRMPNYRNYWKMAGYVEEMEAIEAALAAGQRDGYESLMSDRWLNDCTLSGTASEVRAGCEAWMDEGLTTPILVPSAVSGGQFKAFEDVFAAFE